MQIFNRIRRWRRKFSHYDPLIKVYISKNAIVHNFNVYKKLVPNLQIAPVLKSNAYGHGLAEVASIVDEFNPPFVVVDSLFEARYLKSINLKSDILVIGYTTPENIVSNKIENVAFTIVDLEQLKNLAEHVTRPTKIHIKFDTGMHRQGLLPSELDTAVDLLKQNTKLIVDGICSHLADADGETNDFTELQIKVWNELVNQWNLKYGLVKWQHLSATHGALQVSEAAGNVMRLGIGLFGIDKAPSENEILKPVLRMETIISSIKKIKAGESVGYNLTFTTDRDLVSATIPVGYYEGVDRRLSNIGEVIVNDKNCKLIGRVSMNISSIDVSSIACSVGDKVVVISNDPRQVNSIKNIAKKINTIPYEVAVHIPQHLRRIVED